MQRTFSSAVILGFAALGIACESSYVKPMPPDAAEPVVPINVSDRSPAMTTLSSLTLDIPVGATLGQLKGGARGSCTDAVPITYRSGAVRSDTQMYESVFKEVMTAAGIPVQQAVQRFEGEEIKKADFQVAATISELVLNICYPEVYRDKAHAVGQAYVKIDWALFSPLEKSIVYSATTAGRTAPNFDTRLGEPGILREAFRDALVRLAAKPDFADVVARKKAQASDTSKNTIVITQPGAGSRPIGGDLEPIRSAVVTVRSNSGEGSGFGVGDGTYVVTAAHVVSGSANVKMLGAGGEAIYGEVVRTNKKRDLALIKVTSGKIKGLHVSLAPARPGLDVYAIGSPLGEQYAFSLTRGIVSALRKLEESEFIQSDVRVLPGSSGGPLIDSQGNVVGVTSSGVSINGAPAGMNFFIPATDVFSALSLTPAPSKTK